MIKYKNNSIDVTIYVDNNLVIRMEEGIAEVGKLLKAKGLKLKVQDDICGYLSCDIKISQDSKLAII